jgi:death-on-curing protein
MRYLSVAEVIELHSLILAQTGEPRTIRDQALLESAVAQPAQTFAGVDLYPTLLEKAAALGFALNKNPAFLNGNKRVAHAAMEATPILNGMEIRASVDDAERISLGISDGSVTRDGLQDWLSAHVVPIGL